MSRRRPTNLALIVLTACAALALLALCPAESALAQCPMCRTGAMSAGAGAMRALNLGILVLLIPPVGIFCSIFVIALKNRK